MSKFIKKPVVIEAMQFTNESKNQCYNFVRSNVCADTENGKPIMKIQTIHGDIAIVRIGDWIVKEPLPGFYYPVKPDIFAATYELTEED